VKKTDYMDQNHVLDISAEVLIGRIFLKGEAKFTAEDMEVAGILLKSVDLPQNVQDFLEIVIGSRVRSCADIPSKSKQIEGVLWRVL